MEHQECLGGKTCAISQSPCPGVCIYAEVFDTIDLSVICFDLEMEKIAFKNPTATRFVEPIINQDGYSTLISLLFPKSKDLLSSTTPTLPQRIKYDNKIFGYSVYPISDNRFVWVFIRDITNKLRLESIAEAVNSMNNLGYVFSGIRHEIGNPVNSVKMALSVLKENLDDFSKEDTLEFVDRALSELQRVEFLLKTLRNINMHEVPSVEKTDIPVFLEHFVSLILKDSAKKGIYIKTDFQLKAKWAHVDPRTFQQVLLNIFTNAADALEDRDIPTIVISTTSDKGLLWITVKDNGCGIADRDINDVCKPFFTSKPHGTGLGLVLCRKMLASMDCTIEIESTENEGTTVSISIPEDPSGDQ